MALWSYELELEDGSRVENVLRSGSKEGARHRLERIAENRGARILRGPTLASTRDS